MRAAGRVRQLVSPLREPGHCSLAAFVVLQHDSGGVVVVRPGVPPSAVLRAVDKRPFGKVVSTVSLDPSAMLLAVAESARVSHFDLVALNWVFIDDNQGSPAVRSTVDALAGPVRIAVEVVVWMPCIALRRAG